MLKRLFIVSLFIAALFLCSTISYPASDSPKAGEGQQIKGPIVITAETLFSDNKARTALFEGTPQKQVVAKSENMTLYSDKMLVYYAENTGNVTKIDAEGRVKLIKEGLVVTSNFANYFAEEDKVVFTGEPKAVEKGNVVTGTKMTYLLKEDRSKVENPRILMEEKKGK